MNNNNNRYICVDCVKDIGLKDFIDKQKNDILNKCCFCDNNKKCIKLGELLDYIKICINKEYDEIKENIYYDSSSRETINSLPIKTLLKYELSKDELLYNEIIKFIGENKKYKHNNFKNYKKYNQILDKWNKFCVDIKYKNRYFFNSKIFNDLTKIIKIYKPFENIKINREFYRGRAKKSSEEYLKPFDNVCELCPPPIDKISEQRYNQKFISAFYTSTKRNIILDEIDDIMSKSITIATFKNIKNLKVFNMFLDNLKLPSLFSEVSENRAYSEILYRILQEISIPADVNKKEYIIPQIFAEFLRKEFKIDGLCYISTKSYEETGYNYVFFCGRDNFEGINEIKKKDIWFKMVSNSIELYLKESKYIRQNYSHT